MIRQLVRQIRRGPDKAPREPGWSTLIQGSRRTQLGRAYVRTLMVCLISLAIFLLVTADSRREVVEALVMGLVFTIFPWIIANAVPTHWVLVGEQGLRLQIRDQGRFKLPWGQIKDVRIQNTTMTGPMGPFYEDAPSSTLANKGTFFDYMQQDHWSVLIITDNRWIHINARDFDTPEEAGRVLASHLLQAGMVECRDG